MLYKKAPVFLTAFILAVLVVVAGCDTVGTTTDEVGQGSILMKANHDGTSTQTHSFLTSQGEIRSNDGTNEIVIQEVKFFLEEFELDGAGSFSDFELEDLDDFIVHLPLDGSPVMITQAEIPAGFYDEFEMEIAKPDSDVQVTDPDFRDETGNYSVVVKGLFNDEPFTFRSSEDFEINVDLEPPMEISDAFQSTLVVNIFVAVWFTGADGIILNPKQLENLEQINKNIENSFEAFEDSFDD